MNNTNKNLKNYSSKRLEKAPAYFFSELDQIIAKHREEGKDIIRLDIGSPDLPPHPSVMEKLYRSSLDPSSHGYQSHLGTKAYRQAWAKMYKKVFDVSLDPKKSFIPLTGTKEGIFYLLKSNRV